MRHVAETHIQLITDTMVQEVRPQLIERIERLESPRDGKCSGNAGSGRV